jgi:hypothetical protein
VVANSRVGCRSQVGRVAHTGAVAVTSPASELTPRLATNNLPLARRSSSSRSLAAQHLRTHIPFDSHSHPPVSHSTPLLLTSSLSILTPSLPPDSTPRAPQPPAGTRTCDMLVTTPGKAGCEPTNGNSPATTRYDLARVRPAPCATPRAPRRVRFALALSGVGSALGDVRRWNVP